MRIAKLYMDAQDKTKFEIEGKSSVKYHLKANHVVEAKRWFWVLNNAIQWTKDEAKAEQRHRQHQAEALFQAKSDKASEKDLDVKSISKVAGRGLIPATAVGLPLTTTTSRDSEFGVNGEDNDSGNDFTDLNYAVNDTAESSQINKTAVIAGDLDADEEYGDDASEHEVQPTSKDVFNITAHAANLQLNLLSHVSAALQAESSKDPSVSISHPTVSQAISTYEAAVGSLQGLVGDLLKISRDRDAYWQYRLDREADMRRMWEDSMAKVAKEQEELEGRIGESEDKRKRTKRALREALEGTSAPSSLPGSRRTTYNQKQISDALLKVQLDQDDALPRRKSFAKRDANRRKSTIAQLANISDSDSDENEEFFDAVDAGEVEVIGEMPLSPPPPVIQRKDEGHQDELRDLKEAEIASSFKGYEDPVRTRLKLDQDDRPKISLWVSQTYTVMLLMLTAYAGYS